MNRAARLGLILVAGVQAQTGIWGLVAPRGFFANFPGAGHRWVSALGPYNEHLVRDYAAAELGLAVLLVAAAARPARSLVSAAGAAFLASTVPHFAYHLTTTDSFSTADNLASLGGFVLEIVLVAAAMVLSNRPRQEMERWPESSPPSLTASTRSAG